jgi:hypothetical protein
MRRTVVNPKGQVTIGFELRKRLEIKPGHSRQLEGRARPICDGSDDFAAQERNQEDSSRPNPASRPHLTNCLRKQSASEAGKSRRLQSPFYAPTASCPPSGRKYCVPLIGSLTLRSNSCKSSLRSTKSMSEVLTISRSDDV